MDYDEERIDEAALALLAAFCFDDGRTWKKGFDFEVMCRLHAQGLVDDPKCKARSMWLTPEGLGRGRQCAERLFVSEPPA